MARRAPAGGPAGQLRAPAASVFAPTVAAAAAAVAAAAMPPQPPFGAALRTSLVRHPAGRAVPRRPPRPPPPLRRPHASGRPPAPHKRAQQWQGGQARQRPVRQQLRGAAATTAAGQCAQRVRQHRSVRCLARPLQAAPLLPPSVAAAVCVVAFPPARGAASARRSQASAGGARRNAPRSNRSAVPRHWRRSRRRRHRCRAALPSSA